MELGFDWVADVVNIWKAQMAFKWKLFSAPPFRKKLSDYLQKRISVLIPSEKKIGMGAPWL